jgi:Spy/CpxP family protein refolding chaperone
MYATAMQCYSIETNWRFRMKTSTKIILTIATGTVLLVGAGVGIASGYEHRPGKGCDKGFFMKGHGHGMKAVYKLDDLTDEQKDQLDAFRKEQRDAIFENMDAMQDNRRALKDAMQDGLDMETVRKLAREQGNYVEAMIIQRAEAQQKLGTILTDAQMAELKSMKKNRWRHDQELGD